jgi:hypothetical protein
MRTLGAYGLLVCLLSLAAPARAQDFDPARLRHGHDIEIEFRGALSLHPIAGAGVGAHVAVPLVVRGPLEGTDNNLAFALGGDRSYAARAGAGGAVFVPAALRWNLFLSPARSVFADAGAAVFLELRGSCSECAGADAAVPAVYPMVGGGARRHFRGDGLFPTLSLHAMFPGGIALEMSF